MISLVIRHDTEWGDWIVLWKENGRVDEEKSYHAYSDKQDAIETMHDMYLRGLDEGLDIQEDSLYSLWNEGLEGER